MSSYGPAIQHCRCEVSLPDERNFDRCYLCGGWATHRVVTKPHSTPTQQIVPEHRGEKK